MIHLELFIAFLKVGCFAFGGGYGAVSLIREIVLSNGWLSEETLTYMIAVSESTPGPIMVNMATYIGASQAGFGGAFIATAAVVLPSFLIILLVTALLKTALKHPWLQAALGGVKPCVIGIILATGGYMALDNCISVGAPDLGAIGVTAALAAVLVFSQRVLKRKLSPITFILISAGIGIIAYGI